MPRLFVALVPPPAVARALTALRGDMPGARWLPEPALHVTLRFLGEVPDADAVASALAEIKNPAVRVRLDRRAAFPGARRARVLVALGDASPALAALHHRVEAATAPFVPPEPRPFRPHVTLARLKGADADAVRRWLDGPPPDVDFEVTEIVLFESHPGSDYRALAVQALGSP